MGSFDLKNGLIENSHRVVFSKKLLEEKWDNAMGKMYSLDQKGPLISILLSFSSSKPFSDQKSSENS